MDDENARADRARHGSPYLNTDQAAAFLGLHRRSLQYMRERGTGPVWRRHSRIVHYHIDDLIAWSEAQSRAEKPS